MAAQIQVELIGANGSRTTEVKAAGFTTRHINRATRNPSLSIKVTPHLTIAPRESVPSIFGDEKLSDRKSAPKPTSPPVEKQISTPTAPKQPLAELLAEVKDLLNPPTRRSSTSLKAAVRYTKIFGGKLVGGSIDQPIKLFRGSKQSGYFFCAEIPPLFSRR